MKTSLKVDLSERSLILQVSSEDPDSLEHKILDAFSEFTRGAVIKVTKIPMSPSGERIIYEFRSVPMPQK